MLTEVALAFHALAVHPSTIHTVADVAKQGLHSGGGVQRVIDVVVARRREVTVPLAPCGAVIVIKHDELEFRGDERHEASLCEAINLSTQHLSG